MSEIAFIASLPMVQTAVSIGGDGSVRIKLEVPEIFRDEALKLSTYAGKTFRVTVVPDAD